MNKQLTPDAGPGQGEHQRLERVKLRVPRSDQIDVGRYIVLTPRHYGPIRRWSPPAIELNQP